MATLVDPHHLKDNLRRKKASAQSDEHPVNQRHRDDRDLGQRVADQLAAGMGSWPFLIIQTLFMVVWVSLNIVWLANRGWDPYPFILLNLCLSLQATYAGPIVLLAGNRQSVKDRLTLEHAADEAEKGGEAISRILDEIRKNTVLTREILDQLEAK
jgi:uncharacterized membrane protein